VDKEAMTRVQESSTREFRRDDSKPAVSLQEAPCDHCGLPTNAIRHEQHVFCCHGCQGAYSLIHQMGLDDYYALRDASFDSTLAASGPEFLGSESAHAAIDSLNDLDAAGVAVHKTAEGLCEVRLGVEGLHCAACTWLIERIQPSIVGVHAAQVRMNDRSIRLVYDSQVTSPAQVAKQLARLGYLLLPMTDDEAVKSSFLREQQDHWVAIAIAAFLAANAMWIGIALYAGEATGMAPIHTFFLKWIGTSLGVLAAVFPGRVFFRSAVHAIRSRTAHVDIPVALALGIGTLGSIWGSATGRGHIYFDSLASLVLLLRIGRYIQFRSQYQTSLSLSKLFRWRQTLAQRVESDGTIKTVSTSRLAKNDIVLIQPGQTLPADGFVVDGHSHLNVSWLTGESQPKSISVGDQVIGGTMNIESPIRVCVTESGKESRIGQLEEVISNAAGKRTPLVRDADKIGRWFVVLVLLLAIITWLAWLLRADLETATLHTVALLTIACPCAIALAAPLVITVTIGRAARNQIWIRDGECVERLAKPGIVWFDKTGTLTTGKMRVDAWDGSKRSLEYAAAIESKVHHPLAGAVIEHLRSVDDATDHTVDSFRVWEGLGVSGRIEGCEILVGSERLLREQSIVIEDSWCIQQAAILTDGRTPVWVAIDGRIEGMGAIGDYLRPDAIETLRQLQSRGWKLGMLSGDRQAVIDYWESNLARAGIRFYQCWGDCTPEQKVSKVQSHPNAQSGCVVFVGDGINDAAALAVADVGIAVRGSSDIGLRAAPVYIGDNRLASIERLFRASQASVRTIQRCFAMSIVYNTLTISMAMLGWIHPLIAAIFMPISGVTVLALAIAGRSFPKSELK
jgi:P-type Cu2+ transporter